MKVLLGMSGGLDSTYAAKLLRDAGHAVTGAVLQMHAYTELAEAERSAREVGVPLRVLDCRAAFEERVVADFMREYRSGRTPNPCVVCNAEVKFRNLYEYAMQEGFDAIATGHYCALTKVGERFAVRLAADPTKDQSYMLWRLPQDILSRLLLPLGEAVKREVREAATAAGLSAGERKDSQEICFIPDHDHAAFLAARLGPCPEGNFVDETGRVLGRHRGIDRYTVGQRKGLGVALGHRMFVQRIRPQENEIVLAPVSSEKSERFSVSDLVFSGLAPTETGELTAEVKIRYAASPIPAHIRFRAGGATVTPLAPIRSLTPGQSAVFYRDGTVLFGGLIDSPR